MVVAANSLTRREWRAAMATDAMMVAAVTMMVAMVVRGVQAGVVGAANCGVKATADARCSAPRL